MLTYSFENIGTDSLYEHLYKCIKNDITHGALAKNTKLPSKRSFAKHLGVSVITIENAYNQLIAEGYIYSLPKKGFFVADISLIRIFMPSECEENLITEPKGNCHTASFHAESCYANSYTADSYYTKSYYADFLSNYTTTDSFPFSIWAKLTREILSEKDDILMTPSPAGGIYQLRTAIAAHLREFRGMSIKPEQIIIGAGTEYLYGLLIQLLGQDKIFGVENPGYRKISQIYKSNHVDCRYIRVESNGISIDDLISENVDIIHLSPSHHFPTGVVTPISKRYELLSWASQSKNRYIIEDDYDCEFRMHGKPIPALQSIDPGEKVIYMNTFTKTLTPTIRISYMILPEHLLRQFYDKLGFYSCTVSNFEQYTLARFIGDGYFEKHLNRMRSFYREQRDTIITAIKKSRLASITQIGEEDAGLHFLLKIDTDFTDEELIDRAAASGLRLTCLSQYYNTDSHTPPEYCMHTLVLNYSGVSTEQVTEAIKRLERCILE